MSPERQRLIHAKLAATLEHGDGDGDGDEGPSIEQSDNSLVRLINTMIVEAQTQGVSDIHVETHPGRERIKIRAQCDGWHAGRGIAIRRRCRHDVADHPSATGKHLRIQTGNLQPRCDSLGRRELLPRWLRMCMDSATERDELVEVTLQERIHALAISVGEVRCRNIRLVHGALPSSSTACTAPSTS